MLREDAHFTAGKLIATQYREGAKNLASEILSYNT
jgi:hypothetical protein